MAAITDNVARKRYEMEADGAVAFVDYTRHGDVLVLYHSEVPRSLRGRGIGSQLAGGVLDDIRRRGLHVRIACDFLADFVARNPQYADLIAPSR